MTAVTCDTVLNVWAQQGTWDGVERAEQILYRLDDLCISAAGCGNGSQMVLRPMEHSYSAVINGWAKCRGGGPAAERAQAVLNGMLLTDGRTLGKSNKNYVQPDNVIFNACINAWATSRDPQAGSKSVQLLTQTQELSLKKG